MDFKTLLELSKCGKEYYRKIEHDPGFNVKYPFIDKINSVLEKLNSAQNDILKNNYKSINNIHQLLDKLSEILVAYKYLSEEPCFFKDNSGNPDIYLQKTNKYIEVKRLNNSDYQKSVCDYLQNHGGYTSGGGIHSKELKQANKSALLDKYIYHINKALEQLEGKVGEIYLIYKIDILGINMEEQKFLDDAKEKYSKLKNDSKISLNLINENDLYFPKIRKISSTPASWQAGKLC